MVTTGYEAHRQAISAFSGRNVLGEKSTKKTSIQWQWLLWRCWKGGMIDFKIDFKIDFNAFSEKWTN